MSVASVAAFVVLGLAVGALGTLIGAGGGFLLVPVLVLLYPRDSPAILTSISLAVVFVNAFSGSIAYARMGRIDYRSGLIFAIAGLPGAVFGALMTMQLDRGTFDPLLGGVLVLAAALVLVRPGHDSSAEPSSGRRTLVESDGTAHVYTPRTGLGAWLSLGVGFLSSLLGIGGGIIHVPVMVYALGFPIHVATATSHFVLALLAFAAVAVHASDGALNGSWDRIVPLALGVLVGAQIGAWFSSKVHGRWILRFLALALGSVGIRLLFFSR